jgi:hypothetical protein
MDLGQVVLSGMISTHVAVIYCQLPGFPFLVPVSQIPDPAWKGKAS